jgi:hypothetical protein
VSAASELRDKVEAMWRPGMDLAITTDARGVPGKVLVAICRPGYCGVLVVSAAEYDGLKVAEMAGFDMNGKEVQQPALERAIAAKAAAKGKKR